MADTKITGLTALTTPAAADLIAVVDDVVGTPTTKKVALSDLLTSYIEANISIQEANISDLGTYLTDIVSDTTPQLGGNLDINGASITGSAGTITADDPIFDVSETWNNGAVSFTAFAMDVTDTASAAASLLANWSVDTVSVFAVGKDSKIYLNNGTSTIFDNSGALELATTAGGISLNPGGTANVTIGNFVFDADQTVGAGQDNYVLTYDNGTGLISLEASAGGGGGGAFTADGNSLISPTTSPTLDQATGNEVAFTLDYTVNKATSGNDTGLLVSMTDTASPGTSLLMDLQVGGNQVFKISNAGVTTWENTNAPATAFYLDPNNDYIIGGFGSTDVFAWSKFTEFRLRSTVAFGWTSGASSLSQDTKLWRDAANTLALRNSTNAQTFNIYNSYTDASNYERLEIKWDTNVATIQGVAAGTGTQRNMAIYGTTGTVGTTLTIDPTPNRTSGTAYLNLAVDSVNVIQANNFGLNIGASSLSNGVKINGTFLEMGNGYTVATLPSVTVGRIARVTDASAPAVGSTVSGGGAAAALVWYNGSNWTVIGV